MKASDLHRIDEQGVSRLVGILPQGSTTQERIAKELILDWTKEMLEKNADIKDVCFVGLDP